MRTLAVAGFVLAIVLSGAPKLALIILGLAAVAALVEWWP